MIFKYLLLGLIGAFILYILALPRTVALRKSFVIVFVLTMLVFTLAPEWSGIIANYFGIGRGADLLFYLSHLVLFFIAFMYFLKFKALESRMTRLVRQLALSQALEGNSKSMPQIRT